MNQIYQNRDPVQTARPLILLGILLMLLPSCISSGSTHEDAGINPPDSPRFREGCVGLTPPDSAWPAVPPPGAELVSDASDLHVLLDTEIIGAQDSTSDATAIDVDVSDTTQDATQDATQDMTRTRTLDGGIPQADDSSASDYVTALDAPDADGDAPADNTADAQILDVEDTNAQDSDETDVVVLADAGDAVASDVYDCSEYPATCLDAPSPAYTLQDFQPKSCGFGAIYGLDLYKQEVSVVVLLAAW